jgi:hypothetical protein
MVQFANHYDVDPRQPVKNINDDALYKHLFYVEDALNLALTDTERDALSARLEALQTEQARRQSPEYKDELRKRSLRELDTTKLIADRDRYVEGIRVNHEVQYEDIVPDIERDIRLINEVLAERQ